MMMSIPYELNGGRLAQKRRTREALIASARELVANGEAPTVEAAAEAASISRTTAYRYFPNQRALPTLRPQPSRCYPTTHPTTWRRASTSSSPRSRA